MSSSWPASLGYGRRYGSEYDSRYDRCERLEGLIEHLIGGLDNWGGCLSKVGGHLSVTFILWSFSCDIDVHIGY